MHAYLPELAMVMMIHMLAVISPGPDFAVIVRQSVVYGRGPAIWSSFGVGVGILVHLTYSLFGIGMLVMQSQWLFALLQYLGAIYLLYVAWGCLQAVAHIDQLLLSTNHGQSVWASFRIGFFTNLLNPKATIFFISIFALVINPATPIAIQVLYGLVMFIVTSVWFVLVATLMTGTRIRHFYSRFGHWLERAMGVGLLAVSLRLFYDAMSHR
jgi:RhtB (resistance to homoserine/threonine) family protein